MRSTGQGADIIAFNQGDGLDTVASSTTKDNVLSLGGGILYADLLFQKSGNNLILKAGGTDQITFTNYYASASNRSVDNLQIVIEGTSDYDSGSGDALRNKKIATFNFDGLMAAFDAAFVANPGLTTWALTNALVAQHLATAAQTLQSLASLQDARLGSANGHLRERRSVFAKRCEPP